MTSRAVRSRRSGAIVLIEAVARLAIGLVAQYRLEQRVGVPSAAIIVAPHRSMFDLPAGIHTFRRLHVTPIVVVSQRIVGQLRAPARLLESLRLLPIPANAEGRGLLLRAGGC